MTLPILFDILNLAGLAGLYYLLWRIWNTAVFTGQIPEKAICDYLRTNNRGAYDELMKNGTFRDMCCSFSPHKEEEQACQNNSQ